MAACATPQKPLTPDGTVTKAELSLRFEDIVYRRQGNDNVYDHKRVFEEHNGVGATLTEGRICSVKTQECPVSGKVNYRIEGNGTFVLEGQNVYTRENVDPLDIIIKYLGKDDHGNPISVEQRWSQTK